MDKTPAVSDYPATTHLASVWGGFALGSGSCLVALVNLPERPSLLLNAVFGNLGALAFVGIMCITVGIAGAFLASRQWEKQRRFPLLSIAGFALCGLLLLFPSLLR